MLTITSAKDNEACMTTIREQSRCGQAFYGTHSTLYKTSCATMLTCCCRVRQVRGQRCSVGWTQQVSQCRRICKSLSGVAPQSSVQASQQVAGRRPEHVIPAVQSCARLTSV